LLTIPTIGTPISCSPACTKTHATPAAPSSSKAYYAQAGLEAVNKALDLKNDYFEALTYKNLLLRTQANLSRDPAEQQRLCGKRTNSASRLKICGTRSAKPRIRTRPSRRTGVEKDRRQELQS
jgi:hypothetical protein